MTGNQTSRGANWQAKTSMDSERHSIKSEKTVKAQESSENTLLKTTTESHDALTVLSESKKGKISVYSVLSRQKTA